MLVSSLPCPNKWPGGVRASGLLLMDPWRELLSGRSSPLVCQNMRRTGMPGTRVNSDFRCLNVQHCPSAHLVNQRWKTHTPPFIMEKRNPSGSIYKFHEAQEEIPCLSLRYACSETHLEASSFQLISDFLSNLPLFTCTTGKAKRRCHS